MEVGKRVYVAGAAMVGLIVLMCSGGWLLNLQNRNQSAFAAGSDATSMEFAARGVASPSAAPASPFPSPPTELVVHVAGAVRKPGIYRFKKGDRVFQAIEAAGGFTPEADQGARNQADFLVDGAQIQIPLSSSVGSLPTAWEAGSTSLPGASPIHHRKSTLGTSSRTTQTEKLRTPGSGSVNINTADLEELQHLPGVGPAMAQRILDYRQSIGRFANTAELQDVRGIGAKTFAKMQPFVRVE